MINTWQLACHRRHTLCWIEKVKIWNNHRGNSFYLIKYIGSINRAWQNTVMTFSILLWPVKPVFQKFSTGKPQLTGNVSWPYAQRDRSCEKTARLNAPCDLYDQSCVSMNTNVQCASCLTYLNSQSKLTLISLIFDPEVSTYIDASFYTCLKHHKCSRWTFWCINCVKTAHVWILAAKQPLPGYASTVLSKKKM